MQPPKEQIPLAIKAGQCLIIYDDKRIYLKHTFEKTAFIMAHDQYFLGTEDEVEFKIFELGLPDIPFSKKKTN